MRETGRVIRIIALWMLLFGSATAEAQTARISGTVRDALSGDPVVGIPVYLLGTSWVTITTDTGRYTFTDVQAGQRILMAVGSGYAPRTDTLVVAGDADLTRDFNLTRLATRGDEPSGTPPNVRPDGRAGTFPDTDEGGQLPELTTICDCFVKASTILDEAISLRKRYQTLEEYESDGAAVDRMKTLIDSWRLTQLQCLRRFGTELFIETTCNHPDEISQRRRVLDELGIRS